MASQSYYFVNTTAGAEGYFSSYVEALRFALDLADSDSQITGIVFIVPGFQNAEALNTAFEDDKMADKLRKGIAIRGHKVSLHSMSTYSKGLRSNEVIICSMLDAEQAFKVDDDCYARAIIGIPWRMETLQEWINQYDAKDIALQLDSAPTTPGTSVPNPARKLGPQHIAVSRLASMVNMSSPFNHPNDEEDGKGMARELALRMPELDIVDLKRFMVNELHFENKDASLFMSWFEKAKTGQRFQGGMKTIHRGAFAQWKKQSEEQ
ncbi:MAG: hypothetical protein JST66_12195 [Bacteroidetes bacterium]|nr:hypothetical protein [Bacteroidota bacterium]